MTLNAQNRTAVHMEGCDFPCSSTGDFALVVYSRVYRKGWAGPGGTAIPGQPVAKAEQAPDTSPSSKNQFNIVVAQWETYQILS